MELGIKGHVTRGDEVIKILEMLGGKNLHTVRGTFDNYFYYIGEKYICNSYIGSDEIKGYEIFSLEEFLKKFPYKVGDKVEFWSEVDYYGRTELETSEIISMRWNSARCEVAYRLKGECKEFYKSDIKCKVNDDENLFHTTNEYEDIVEKSFQGGYEKCKLDIQLNGYELPDGFHFTDENGNVIDAKKIQLVKNASSYPKTYDECCKIIGYFLTGDTIIGHKTPLLRNFQKLLVCRDAYWKIAGEELGLDKPWEPDFSDDSPKYNIFKYENEITLSDNNWSNRILVFPTIEMRNAFYENFKDLIEQCKELL